MKIDKIQEFLIRAKTKNKISNAYIVYGGIEKEREELAIFLSCLLNCPHNPPCQTCSVCKLINKKAFPDIRWVIPSKSILSIDDVRQVKEEIYITPYYGNRKIYIFDINYMRDESANAFLKILEEPPLYSVLIILSKNINFFLPTIVSRCQKLRLNYAIPKNIEEFKEPQKEFVLMLEQLEKNRLFDFFRTIDSFVKKNEREDIERWLEKIIFLYRDVYLKQHSVGNEMLLKTGIETGVFLSENSVVTILEDLLETKERIRYNVNLKLGLENLFLQINQLY
jgi:DNA polymerase-3 subunit delta'